MSEVQTRHGALYYATVGAGPPLVLIHGNTYTAATQERLAERFADEHQVISIDLLGHGHSARPPGLFSTRYFAIQGEALADLLGAVFPTAPVAILGMSAGGITALNAICERPDRVAALVLDGVFMEVSPETAAAHQQSTAAMAPAWHTFMRGQHGADWWPQLNAGVEAAILEMEAAGTIVTPCLEQIGVPTLIFQGGRDAFVPDEQANAVAEAIPGARLVYVAEGGHLQAWHDQAAFHATVRAFLHEIGYRAIDSR